MIAAQIATDDKSRQPRNPAEDLARKRRLYRAYETNKRAEMDEAQEARRYYFGKQWTDAEIAVLRRRRQPIVWVNKIRRKIDFLVGVEQRMRRDPKAYPRNPADEASANAASAAIRFVCDLNRWEHIASDSANDGFVSGVAGAFVGIEPFRGGFEVKLKIIAPDRFFYDPRSVKPDFSDARYMGMHLWMDVDEAKEAWPQFAQQFDSMVSESEGLSAFKAEQDRMTQWGDFTHRRVRVVEFWEKRGQGWYYCKFSSDLELESMDSPYVDEDGNTCCPYIVWSPYIDEKGDRHGVVRDMRPIQDEVNHRRSKFLHMLNVRQTHAQKGTIEDIDDLRMQLAQADGAVEHNGEWGKTVGIIDYNDQVKGQAELLVEAKTELENLGPNPGLIGRGGGIADQSGRAILAQRDAGMTELSPVFDRLRDWKLRVYRAIWARIRQAWTGERWIRVTDQDETKFLGINQYQMSPMGQIQGQNVLAEVDVDIILDEGPDSITMQEEEFEQLTKMAQAGIPIPPQTVIKASSLRNKQELLDSLEQKPDPKADMELDKGKADADLKRAQTVKTLAEADMLDMQTGNLGMQGQPIMLPPIVPFPPGMMPPPGGPMNDNMGGPMPPPGMPPDQMPPEAMSPDGALPIDPNLALMLPPA